MASGVFTRGQSEDERMLKLRTVITYVGYDPDDPPRGFRKALREGMKEVLAHWHKTYRPLHFQPVAYSRYGYSRREGGYEKRKQKIKGHTRPLVWSGDLEAATANAVKITSSIRRSDGAATGRVTMTVPEYATMRARKSGRSDISDELTRVTQAELEAMARMLDRILTAALGADRTRKTVSIAA
jgi:hypothetical protein